MRALGLKMETTMKEIAIPIILFIISAFLTLMSFPLIFILILIGIILYIKSRVNKNNEKKYVLLARSGLSLIISPIITASLAMAGMAGLFSIFTGK